MHKIICPFCGNELTEEIEPDVAQDALGNVYTCYLMICRNKDKHYGNGNIVIPFKKELKNEIQSTE